MTSLRLCELECEAEYGRGEFSSSNLNRNNVILLPWLRWFLLGPQPLTYASERTLAYQKSAK